jgi:hypothetical protein
LYYSTNTPARECLLVKNRKKLHPVPLWHCVTATFALHHLAILFHLTATLWTLGIIHKELIVLIKATPWTGYPIIAHQRVTSTRDLFAYHQTPPNLIKLLK